MTATIVLIERESSTHRHLGIVIQPHGMVPICRRVGTALQWQVVPPDPASARPMCLHCLKAADRVADLADRQEGVE